VLFVGGDVFHADAGKRIHSGAKPMASAMAGVPASNFQGSSLGQKSANELS
jgi:hypothetical protein